MLYWIEYTDGSTAIFEVSSQEEAREYFQMEGDHAVDFGPLNKEPYPLEGQTGWMVEVDPNEGQAIHRTRKGKGAVGQAIQRHKGK